MLLKNRPFPPDRESGAKLFILKPYRTTDRKRRKISEHSRPETAEPHQTTTHALFFPGRRYFPPDRESETRPLFLFIQSHTEPPAGNGAKSVSTPARKQRSLIRQQRAHCSFPADVISRPTGNQRYNILVYLFKAIPNHQQETAQNQ